MLSTVTCRNCNSPGAYERNLLDQPWAPLFSPLSLVQTGSSTPLVHSVLWSQYCRAQAVLCSELAIPHSTWETTISLQLQEASDSTRCKLPLETELWPASKSMDFFLCSCLENISRVIFSVLILKFWPYFPLTRRSLSSQEPESNVVDTTVSKYGEKITLDSQDRHQTELNIRDGKDLWSCTVQMHGLGLITPSIASSVLQVRCSNPKGNIDSWEFPKWVSEHTATADPELVPPVHIHTLPRPGLLPHSLSQESLVSAAKFYFLWIHFAN